MRLYNTLKRTKEEFVPITQGTVKMYACGPTVYNYFHIGNARPFIVFDTIRRYLEYVGYRVEFVQNFTDIDDKMINKARQEGISVKELADKYIDEYYKDAQGLGIKRATHHPRATENIGEIVILVQTLIDKGLAYELNGDVYFDTTKFEGYGKLSHQTIEDLEAGARIEVNENKRHPMDFVLWKAQKPGEPAWDSPWGRGRPGWHIECSAMAMKYLGDTIDIHGGGQDLIFPHHENEIAQSEGSTGRPFAKYWLHNGYINVDNQKMSKSLGNFFTVRDIAKEYDLEVVRLFMLSAHYRNPINFSKELLDQAKSALERLYNAKNNLMHLRGRAAGMEIKPGEQTLVHALDEYREKFKEQMDDDFNTADALAVIFEMVREINSALSVDSSKIAIDKALAMLNELTSVLGLLTKDDNSLDDEIKKKIELREQARRDKNWELADAIRDELLARGIILRDTPHGVKVTKQS